MVSTHPRKMLLGMGILLMVSVGLAGITHSQVKISLWAASGFSPAAEQPVNAQIFKDIFSSFERTYPDIKLDWKPMPALEEFKTKLLIAAAVGALPDVANPDSFWVPKLVRAAVPPVPLNEFWPEEERQDWFDFATRNVTFNGKIYAMWFDTDVRVWYYRKDWFKEVGLDPDSPPAWWPGLIHAAEKLTGKREGAEVWGIGAAMGRSESVIHEWTLPMFWARGGKLVDDQGKPIFHKGKNGEILSEILQFYYNLIYTHKVMPVSNIEIPGFWHGLNTEIYANKYAMYPQGSWFINELKTYTPDTWDKWNVSYIPVPEGTGRFGSASGGWTYVIYTRDPDKQKAAAKFIKWVNKPEYQTKWTKETGHIPTRQSIFEKEPYFKGETEDPFSPYACFFGKVLEVTGVRPGVPMYITISEELQIAIGNVLSKQLSPEEAIDEAAKACMKDWERLKERG